MGYRLRSRKNEHKLIMNISNEQKQVLLILNKIIENVSKMTWNCMHQDCTEKSINSHLLQRNGILNLISNKNLLVEFSVNNPFEMQKNGKYSFKQKNISSAFSMPLFCDKHDSAIFQKIERGTIGFFNYETQLLFSYRAVCAEIRKKEIVVETEQRQLNSNLLNSLLNNNFLSELNAHILMNKLGIKDLNFYKEEFERNIYHSNLELYKFKTIKYSRLDVCISSVFSPISEEKLQNEDELLFQETPWNSVILNVIPQSDGLYVIIGYHKDLTSPWIEHFIESLMTEELSKQQYNISDLLASRVNTFTISLNAYNKIPAEKKEIFIKYWEENWDNLSQEQFFGINLFE